MIGVLASGTGSNFGAIIEAGLPVAVLIANRPDAKALERARRADIPAVLVDHHHYADRADFDRALVEALRAHRVEWVALAGFMRIVGPPLLEAFPRRILNVHPALLPAFPGLHAQRQAIAAGAKIAGCTVHLVDAGVDTGPTLAQAALPVLPEDDEKSLAARILRLEHRLYPAVLAAALAGRVRLDGARAFIGGGLDLAPAAGALFSPR